MILIVKQDIVVLVVIGIIIKNLTKYLTTQIKTNMWQWNNSNDVKSLTKTTKTV